MALESYGVVIGTVQSYHRDDPDDFGKYYHGHVKVLAAGTVYNCAIDVDSKASNVGVQWRTPTILPAEMGPVPALANGYHALASTPNSGALDYIRRHYWKGGCIYALLQLLGITPTFMPTYGPHSWTSGVGADALDELEPILDQAQRIFIFGEPYTNSPTDKGMHNIHQNQGDPLNSPWGPANGIWQDGGTIVETAGGTYLGFLNKFSTQAFETDNNGDPA